MLFKLFDSLLDSELFILFKLPMPISERKEGVLNIKDSNTIIIKMTDIKRINKILKKNLKKLLDIKIPPFNFLVAPEIIYIIFIF